MTRTVTFTLSTLLMLFAQCAEHSVPPEQEPEEFIPMAVGNQWIYLDELVDSTGNPIITQYDTVRILRDTTINNNRWFYFNRWGHLRNSPEGVWQYLPYPFRAYPTSVGDSVLQANGITYRKLTSSNAMVSVPKGAFECLEISERNPDYYNALLTKTFLRPGVGVIKRFIYSVSGPNPIEVIQLVDYQLQ